VTRDSTGGGWAYLAVVLAGVFPFASDMFRNFQLFTPDQLAWAFAAVWVGTSVVFLLAWASIYLIKTIGLRHRARVGSRLPNGIYAMAVAVVLAVFLYDSNMTELRQSFGLSRWCAAGVCALLFAVYWALAARLGTKRTCALLAGLLVFRFAQTGLVVSHASGDGDELVSSEERGVYQSVKLDRTPNIYLICLESYHGFDAIEELYGFDNREFRNFLEQQGFSIAEETLANYWYTMSSLQSFLQMGHHYEAGKFGNHDSLYARGFISGSATYFNPVLNILKQNGYSIVYLLPSDYYYRPGAGLVDHSLLEASWPFAPLKVSLPRFIGREPDTPVENFEQKVSETISAWPVEQPTFFFTKLGAEHSAHRYDYKTDRSEFVLHYIQAVRQANPTIEALCQQIIRKDPQGLIILTGDHGAQSYKTYRHGYYETLREEQIPSARLVRDLHEVLLAIRWGEGVEASRYPFHSLVNVIRFVLSRLGGGDALLKTAAADSSYLSERGILYQTSQDGQPLKAWRPVSRDER